MQGKDGSFAVLCNSVPSDAVQPNDEAALALHALLLDVLRDCGAWARPVCDGLAGWLVDRLQAQLTNGTFASRNPYATFHALASVQAYCEAAVDQSMIAAAVRYLIEHEVQPGGPYYQNRPAKTGQTKRVELLPNLAIARFISLVADSLAELDAAIVAMLAGGTTDSDYTALWPLAFLLAQTYGTEPTAIGAGFVRAHLVNTTHFVAPQFTVEGVTYHMPALEAALRFFRPLPAGVVTKPATTNYTRILTEAKGIARRAGPMVTPTLHRALDQLAAADGTQEIGPLAVRFAPAVTPRVHIPAKTLRQLGIANLYAWVAYTIYDDFLDDEGKPPMLPAANVAMRTAADLFCRAVPGPRFAKTVADTFTTMDAANAWEISHCRFTVTSDNIDIGTLPDYGNLQPLYERSLSHSLPVVGALVASGHALTTPAVRKVRHAFMEYLIIRQLSDDLRDWHEDLRAGHISYIVAELLRGAHIPAGRQPFRTIIPQLEAYFWRAGLATFSRIIRRRAMRARRLLRASGVVEDNQILDELIQTIEDAVERTLSDKRRAEQFAAAYSAWPNSQTKS